MAPIRGRVIRHLISVALILLALDRLPAAAGTPAPGFEDSPVVSGLAAPIALAFLPDGSLLIAEQGGALKLFDGTSTRTLVTIPVCSASEMGLLGVAVDPAFTSNGFIFLYRTKPGPGGCGSSSGRFNQVVRVTMSGGAVNPASLTELLSGIATDNGNHNGGTLRIGPDRKLWVSVGDTGLGDNQGGPGSSTNPYARTSPRSTGRSCAEPRRQRACRQSVREHARRPPRDLGVRVPQPVPHGLRRADRAAVDRRRG
jgi:glucose/arabinose dehydrogenase